MARPREFDRDEALKHAISVFWAKGFEASSTEDLLAAMKIGRQSLYDTFGDKRRLYLEALARYQEVNTANQIALLEGEKSSLAGIHRMLMAVAGADPAFRGLGCMDVGAISEFGQGDAEINAMSRETGAVLQAALEKALRRARSEREVPPDIDISGAANFIRSAMMGLKISAKSGLDTMGLRQIVDLALDALRRR